MRVLLRITAAAAFGWAILLLACKHVLLSDDAFSPIAQGLGNALGIANVVLAYLFWYASRDPLANRGTVYGAIMWTAFKTANDLFDLLVLLPPNHVLPSLGDLAVSLTLLVGLLEALPRLLAGQRPV